MRKFWRVFVVATMSCWLWCSLAFAGTENIRNVTLTWREDPQTSQTITWQTDATVKNGWVEYSEADSTDIAVAGVPRIKAESQLFTTDVRTNMIHSVTLRNLKPGTRYVYRIGSSDIGDYDGMFHTEMATEPFKFLIFGDSQSLDYKVWQDTFNAAYRMGIGARFFVNMGDLVDNGQRQQEWDGWFAGIKRHSGKMAVVPVVGNHETYTIDRKFAMPKEFTQQFYVPQNGPDGLKGQVYSFDYGNVHFVILDTQLGEERSFLPDSLDRQIAWLKQDLAATTKHWKVVFMHRPIYHNRLNVDSPSSLVAFAPIFDDYGIDVVFSGHDHVNARTMKLKGGVPSSVGTVYATTGRSGTKTYSDVGKKSWNEQFINLLDEPTYSIVAVNGNVLLVQVFTQTGKLIDDWSLMKLE